MKPEDPTSVTVRTAFRFWLPLQATWLMMALEGPFLAAIIARLTDPKMNLAAFGVASSIAWIVEAPIIMMLSASNTLVRDKIAYRRLRRFSTTLNLAVTAVMAAIVIPPVFDLVVGRILGVPRDVAGPSAQAMLFLILWPGAIGYRRFYQGILIRQGRPRAVALGTVVRLSVMAVSGIVLALAFRLPGASVGAGAMGAGVLAEAAASRFMAGPSLRRLLAMPDEDCDYGRGLTLREVLRFYFPLALTSFISFSVHPVTTFFLSRSRMPVESLASLPVLMGLAFIFRTGGIASQEVVIALTGDGGENARLLRRFTKSLGLAASAVMAAVVFSPLASFWFRTLSGLSAELAEFALLPARLLVLFPLLEAMLAFRRGSLVRSRRTWPLVAAVAVQMGVLILLYALTVFPLGMIGAVAASLAMTGGYAAGYAALVAFSRRRAAARA